MEERYYSTAEVADMLGASILTVQRWLREGDLPAVFYGGKMGYRIAESDLMAYVDKRKRRKKAAKITAELVEPAGSPTKNTENADS